MIFEQIDIGGDRNFGYIIGDPKEGVAALVDPAYCPEKLVARCQELELRVELILNTHSHPDHINGNSRAHELTQAPILCHEAAAGLLHPDRSLSDGDKITLGSLTISVLFTPGHSPDSICFLVNGKLISGDILFVGKVGGTDLGEGARQEYESLHKKLMTLPDDVEVYPGHNFGVAPSSTIGNERKTNPFLLRDTLEGFIDLKKNWTAYKKKHGIA